MLPIFELNRRSDYRVRFAQTVGSPTDVNHRNPKCRIFVEACEVDDGTIFVEQVGHSEISRFGLPVPLTRVSSSDKILNYFDPSTSRGDVDNVQDAHLQTNNRAAIEMSR